MPSITSEMSLRFTSATVTPGVRPACAVAIVIYGSEPRRK
jgi:hypothetical protein